jgi:hypothetical protein
MIEAAERDGRVEPGRTMIVEGIAATILSISGERYISAPYFAP